jgi:hypothetical protein
VRTIGFHASKDTIRLVVLDGDVANPTVVTHERRPLALVPDRPQFIQNARNLFTNVISTYSPDRLAYVLSMNANSQDQVAGNVLPCAALCVSARDHTKPCTEFIAANFSKSFFSARGTTLTTDRYKTADAILGTHPPNWTNSERLAALAAWGVL